MEKEIELLKASVINLIETLHNHENAIRQLEKTQRVINSDIHSRLKSLENQKPINSEIPEYLKAAMNESIRNYGCSDRYKEFLTKEHYFYKKDIETQSWLVKCAKTGGTFSTTLWRNETIKKQTCPCCGEAVRRK